jgi:hypothetical protein
MRRPDSPLARSEDSYTHAPYRASQNHARQSPGRKRNTRSSGGATVNTRAFSCEGGAIGISAMHVQTPSHVIEQRPSAHLRADQGLTARDATERLRPVPREQLAFWRRSLLSERGVAIVRFYQEFVELPRPCSREETRILSSSEIVTAPRSKRDGECCNRPGRCRVVSGPPN